MRVALAVNTRHKGEPVCRPDLPSRRFSPAILHVGFYQSRGLSFCQQQPWPFLHTSLFCAPSIISQALRAAMVAAEVPLRGKLRAEATIFSTHPLILQVPLPLLACTVVQGLILRCQARIAPCSTHGQKWTCRPRLFCWVLTSDLESGGARYARGPYTHALRARSALRAVRLPLVESGLIVRMGG